MTQSIEGVYRPPRLSVRQAAEYAFATAARRGEIARGAVRGQKGHGSSYYHVERLLPECLRDGVLDPSALDVMRDKLHAMAGAERRWSVQSRAIDVIEDAFGKVPLSSGLVLVPYTSSRLPLQPNPLVLLSAWPRALVVDTATQAVRGGVYLRFSKATPLPDKAGPLAAHLLRTAATTAGMTFDAEHSLVLDTATGIWHRAPVRTKMLVQQYSDAMRTLGGTFVGLQSGW